MSCCLSITARRRYSVGSLQLQTTTTDEFNEALAEHVRMHHHIYDTYPPLHSDRNDVENTLLRWRHVYLLPRSWERSAWLYNAPLRLMFKSTWWVCSPGLCICADWVRCCHCSFDIISTLFILLNIFLFTQIPTTHPGLEENHTVVGFWGPRPNIMKLYKISYRVHTAFRSASPSGPDRPRPTESIRGLFLFFFLQILCIWTQTLLTSHLSLCPCTFFFFFTLCDREVFGMGQTFSRSWTQRTRARLGPKVVAPAGLYSALWHMKLNRTQFTESREELVKSKWTTDNIALRGPLWQVIAALHASTLSTAIATITSISWY